MGGTAYMFFTSKPFVRWWWLGGPFRDQDIVTQLDWVKQYGFGGVELAWVYPQWLDDSRRTGIPEWLGEEWSRLVGFTKTYADEIGLGCDFTFGSAWPFGGRCVPVENASQRLDGSLTAPLHASWEDASDGPPGRVVDHLSARALRNYARVLAPAFAVGLRGSKSALFCDSFEVQKRHLWSHELWESFEKRFGYSLRELATQIDDEPDLCYDYRKHVGETIVREFYATFTEVCHELNARSRVQCHGAPADLLSAYGVVDIPESETLLFNPQFSRIPASAAAFRDKPVVSCETFTCIYGFPVPGDPVPGRCWKREQVADLKLLADAIFANGVNHIVWHGMPFNPPGGRNEFYASVHVGPDSAFLEELKPFNAYLERVSAVLKQGVPCSRLAVYLPNEDYMRLGQPPRETRVPAEQDYWEMRRLPVPLGSWGYNPLWISGALLKDAIVDDGDLILGQMRIPVLYLDVDWLDASALSELHRLARAGLSVVMKGQPQHPGRVKSDRYKDELKSLSALPNVVENLDELKVRPLLEGNELPWFWAREIGSDLLLFIAHPCAREVVYPMRYGQSCQAVAEERILCLNYAERNLDLPVAFGAFESLLVHVDREGRVSFEDLGYTPPPPRQDIFIPSRR